jgi:hypothetical protein
VQCGRPCLPTVELLSGRWMPSCWGLEALFQGSSRVGGKCLLYSQPYVQAARSLLCTCFVCLALSLTCKRWRPQPAGCGEAGTWRGYGWPAELQAPAPSDEALKGVWLLGKSRVTVDSLTQSGDCQASQMPGSTTEGTHGGLQKGYGRSHGWLQKQRW